MKVNNQNNPGENPNYKFDQDMNPGGNANADANMGGTKGGGSKTDSIVNDPTCGPTRLKRG